MNKALWNKAIGEARWLLVFCAVGLFLLCFLRVALLHWMEMSTFAEMLGNVWDKIAKFSTVPLSQILRYDGRIAMVFNEPMLVLVVASFAIARGSDVVSGEIGRGTMEFVLAQPAGRLQVLASQATVGIVGVAILATSAWLGTATGVALITAREKKPPPSLSIPGLPFELPLPFLAPADDEPIFIPLRDEVDPRVFTPATINLFFLGTFLLSLTTLASSWDHHRWRTIGIVLAVCIAMTMLKVFGMAAPALGWMKCLSFFTPYAPEWSVYVGIAAPEQAWHWWVDIPAAERSGLSPLSNNAILLGLSGICYTAAAVIFSRRDLPAPL